MQADPVKSLAAERVGAAGKGTRKWLCRLLVGLDE